MISYIYREIKDLIRSLVIVSQNKFLFGGRQYSPKHTNTLKRSSIVLANTFYTIYHCRSKSFSQHSSNWENYSRIRDFTAQLSASNTGSGTWEGGWKIVRIEPNGRLVVKKDGLTLWTFSRPFKRDSSVLHIGQTGFLKMVSEYWKLSPGFL